MAAGAGDTYWEKRALPSVFKHELLRKYVPQFAGMTGTSSDGRRIVFLDGYAGRGRYEDGRPASGELIMRMAQDQYESVSLAWSCWFVEKDNASATALSSVVAEYAARGVTARAHHGDVLDVWDQVAADAPGCPLFLFLDPCGLGVPFDHLVGLLNGERRQKWPPTEFLLNFSLDAVRRIGGLLSSERSNPVTLARMDAAVGGPWWRDHFADGFSDGAVQAVVDGFTMRISQATGMFLTSTPVRRAPKHKPIYHLVFGTRGQPGLWAFGDSAARSAKAWWDTLEEVDAEQDPSALFTVTATVRPQLESVEAEAVPHIASNLASLLVEQPRGFKVVDHTLAVFGDYYGQVRERAVKLAVKDLYGRGGTASTGVGPKPRDLIVLPPGAATAS